MHSILSGKTYSLLLAMLVAAPLFAWDEFMPVDPGSGGTSLSVYRAIEDNATWDPTFQFKIGIVNRMDLEYSQPFAVDGVQGIDRPNLGIKITLPSSYKLAALAAVSLPVGSESVVGTSPGLRLDLALIHEFDAIGAAFNGFVAYRAEVESFPDGELQLYTAPTWSISGPLSGYIGLSYTHPSGGSGTIGLWPGLDYTINDNLGFCGDFDLDTTIGGGTVLGINLSLYGSF